MVGGGGGSIGSGGGLRMGWGQVQVGAPMLLEAINKNGLAVFLIVSLPFAIFSSFPFVCGRIWLIDVCDTL